MSECKPTNRDRIIWSGIFWQNSGRYIYSEDYSKPSDFSEVDLILQISWKDGHFVAADLMRWFCRIEGRHFVTVDIMWLFSKKGSHLMTADIMWHDIKYILYSYNYCNVFVQLQQRFYRFLINPFCYICTR